MVAADHWSAIAWRSERPKYSSSSCDEESFGTHVVVLHALVIAHVWRDLSSPWSIEGTSDVSLACDEGPGGLMELL